MPTTSSTLTLNQSGQPMFFSASAVPGSVLTYAIEVKSRLLAGYDSLVIAIEGQNQNGSTVLSSYSGMVDTSGGIVLADAFDSFTACMWWSLGWRDSGRVENVADSMRLGGSSPQVRVSLTVSSP